MRHSKFDETYKLVNAGVSVLLTGEKGTGKTTLVGQVAKALDITYYSMSMTRQTTLSHLLGFMNVNGIYVPSQLRQAVEGGGIFLLDEIDASDPNVILCLNTIENGYVSFPDKIVELHKDFRLMATSNPQNKHKEYSGRAKLDAATLDRFDIVDIDRDGDLEKSLVGVNVYKHIECIRSALKHYESSTEISMRDAIRFKKRKELGLLDTFVERLLADNPLALEQYNRNKDDIPEIEGFKECKNLSELWKLVEYRKSNNQW